MGRRARHVHQRSRPCQDHLWRQRHENHVPFRRDVPRRERRRPSRQAQQGQWRQRLRRDQHRHGLLRRLEQWRCRDRQDACHVRVFVRRLLRKDPHPCLVIDVHPHSHREALRVVRREHRAFIPPGHRRRRPSRPAVCRRRRQDTGPSQPHRPHEPAQGRHAALRRKNQHRLRADHSELRLPRASVGDVLGRDHGRVCGERGRAQQTHICIRRRLPRPPRARVLRLQDGKDEPARHPGRRQALPLLGADLRPPPRLPRARPLDKRIPL